MTIDLNVDLGEGFEWDEDLLDLVTTANICCGAHAGSASLAAHTLALARKKGVRACAHPGYPDRENMGRLSQSIETEEDSARLIQSLRAQLAVLKGTVCIKPHGALYHDTGASSLHAAAFLSVLIRSRADLIGFPVGLHPSIARSAGSRFWPEGFADRRYQPDGTLVPRSQPHAVLEDEAEVKEQTLRLAHTVKTICLHGDNPHAVEFAKLVRGTLKDKGWTIQAP
jgi:5-oxoprolinase (ATP-hydrolysing) subunit A